MKIDFLVNNAGVVTIPQFKRTNYDVEMQIGINHFGHFYLTSLLWDKLANCGNPRIINLSSMAHKDHDIDFDDINFDVHKY